MKEITKLIQIITISFVVSSCGGSGSESEKEESPALAWKPPNESECKKLITTNLSASDVDLSNQQLMDVQSVLESVSPYYANQIFLTYPDEFISWVNKEEGTLSLAIHEVHHKISLRSLWCSEPQFSQYFYNGQFYTTSLFDSDTSNYSIVEETLPENLKARGRYTAYIEVSKTASGNRFATLLDELSAYTGDGHFQLDFIESGFEKHHPNYTAYHTFQVDGIVDMMLYLQYYLKSARTNYNDTYKAINEEATVAVISFFWNEAERALIRAYPYYEEAINSNGQSSFFQTHDDYISGLEILKAVYSSEALIELDKLGIDHRTYDDWNSSYLLFDSE